MASDDLTYEQLPGSVKHNLTEEQWQEARPRVIADGAPAPESTIYLNLKNGQLRQHEAGEPVQGPALAAHNLAGGRGRDSSQFYTAPAGAASETYPVCGQLESRLPRGTRWRRASLRELRG